MKILFQSSKKEREKKKKNQLILQKKIFEIFLRFL